jgi:transketolase
MWHGRDEGDQPAVSDLAALETLARRARHRIIRISHEAQSAHLGGALSCVDLLVALYWDVLRVDPAEPRDPARDRLIFSKGHAISALYTVLAMRGFFSEDTLAVYNHPGAGLPEQPSPWKVPGVEWATGSLGHGIGIGLGLALAASLQRQPYATFVLMSDGECQEGSVWESAMLAPRLPLAPLTVLVDFNGWQATGRSREVMQIEPLAAKWESFGWETCEVDGHDLMTIRSALHRPRAGRPRAVVARTIKGKGASFIEDDNNWHYRSPSAEEVRRAAEELGISGP